jgi:hypothetical protein
LLRLMTFIQGLLQLVERNVPDVPDER